MIPNKNHQCVNSWAEATRVNGLTSDVSVLAQPKLEEFPRDIHLVC